MNGNSPAAAEAAVCVARVTPRPDPEHNEDAGRVACAPGAGVHGVAVADGLGSYSRAGQAARQAVREAAAWLQGETEPPDAAGLTRLFAHVHGELQSSARATAGGNDPEPQSFGTTLLVGLDAGAELVAAYAGNGAIWHIRGNFDDSSPTGLPWSAVNLLSPHSVLRGGREALYRLLDAASERPPVPTVVTVSKDPEFGDILLLCTDGICSADQVIHGIDADGSAWIGAEPAMVAFFHALRGLFARWDGEAELPLLDTLHAYLDDLRNREMLEDDATVGVIVTAAALRYHRQASAARAAARSDGTEGTEGTEEGGESQEIQQEAECTASPASPA